MIDLGSTLILLLACFGVWAIIVTLERLAYRRDIRCRLDL